LRLRLGGLDRGEDPNLEERIRIRIVGEGASNQVLFQGVEQLVGNQLFEFHLVDPSVVADGELRAITIARAFVDGDDTNGFLSDFRVKKANLTVKTPEPTSMLLLCFGLIALVRFERKKFIKK
jgi:hypothetical protein